MKTIQEHIKTIDTEAIVNECLYAFPLDFEALRHESDLPMNTLMLLYKDRLRYFVNQLREEEISPYEQNKTPVLFAHKTIAKGNENIRYSLIYKEDISELPEEISTHSYMFVPPEQSLGFFVADTKLTQTHILGLVADYIHKASAFGFNQEHRDHVLYKLCREIDDKDMVLKVFTDELKSCLPIPPDTDETELKLYAAVKAAQENYMGYCLHREIEEIHRLIFNKQ